MGVIFAISLLPKRGLLISPRGFFARNTMLQHRLLSVRHRIRFFCIWSDLLARIVGPKRATDITSWTWPMLTLTGLGSVDPILPVARRSWGSHQIKLCLWYLPSSKTILKPSISHRTSKNEENTARMKFHVVRNHDPWLLLRRLRGYSPVLA